MSLLPAVTYEDIQAAATRLKEQATLTPVLTSRTVDDRTQSQVFFKCENFQRTGSFKFRGAYNALAQLSAEQKQQGVVAYSSGNHRKMWVETPSFYDGFTMLCSKLTN